MVSRRCFIAFSGLALTSSFSFFGADEGPALLDHILLGCSALDRGIGFVEEHTGVRAVFGGVHPGRGTRNALLALGEKHYLEIIAPDPQQPVAPDHYSLQKLAEPRLVGWAAHPGDLNQFAARLREAKLVFDGPIAGSRKRPNGRLLQWKTLNLKDDRNGLLPFFIEWSADTIHPSADAPPGCRIVRFELATPDPEKLEKIAALLGLDVEIVKGAKAQLRATFVGPNGELSLSS